MNTRILFTSLLIWTGACLHADVEVTARFEPSRIAMGSTSRYVVEITDSGTDIFSTLDPINSLPVPSANGLSLRNMQTSSSQSVRISNGRAEQSITQRIVIDAIPASVGSFTIPAYAFDHKGTKLAVPAATLTVVERAEQAGNTSNKRVFLTLETPEKLYVGQTQMITMKLYLAEELDLHRLINFKRDANGFIIEGPPEEPLKTGEIFNGRRYQVFNWPMKITPIRTGKQELNAYFELSIIVPTQRNTRNDPFGRSIFDNFFGKTERVNVYTEPTQIEVLPLPQIGQPESFSGAVGQFNMEVSADAKSTRVGEPIMLSIKLSGAGNFDRIQAPELPEAAGWRSYPPESTFETDDSNALKGKKRFDYIFVPEKAGKLELPGVDFSFLDPNTDDYVELTSPPIAIEVSPSNLPVVAPPKPANPDVGNPTESSIDLTQPLDAEALMLTLDYRPTKGRNLPTGSIFTPLVYWLNGSFLAALSILIGVRYIQKKNRQDETYQFIRTAKQALKAIPKKAHGHDATTFYSHATKAVRLAASIRTKQDLQSADLKELKAELQQLNVSESILEDIQNLFQTADTVRFSGQSQDFDPSTANKQLNSLLKAL